MGKGTVVPALRRAIGAEGRDLLKRFNLLAPLVQQMVTSDAIAAVAVSDEQLEQARFGLLQQRGHDDMDQWGELLDELGRSEEEVLDRLRYGIRRRSFMRERFAPKAEARFLERKNELDQVVYSLLRLENSFLARELYLQIESGESNFADLAKRYAEGPERNTNGIVGPVPSPRRIRAWLRNCESLSQACCWNPFVSRTGGWSFAWSVTRRPRSPMRYPIRCARKCSMPGLSRKLPRS